MPTYQVTDPKTGKTVRLTGDSPPTQAELEQIFSQFMTTEVVQGVDIDVPTEENLALEQQRAAQEQARQAQIPLSEKALGVGEAALTTGTGATTGAIGFGVGSLLGAAGELTGLLDEGEGQQLASEFAGALTYSPKTETGQNITQAIGEFAGAIPAYMGMAPFQQLKAVGAARNAKAKQAVNIARDAIDNPRETPAAKVADVIKRGTEKDLADIVQADPNFYRAADELNINVEPIAAFASKNSQFRDISGALQSVPGSVLDDQAKQFISAVSSKADDLIEQYGGSQDKALVGETFKREALSNIDDLFNQADKVYSDLKTVLPPQTRVKPQNTLDFIALKAMEFGGFDDLPPQLKSIFNRISPKEQSTKGKTIVNPATGARTSTGKTTVTPKTIEKIDQVRKELGQAINKGTGPFKDAEIGLNKALYAKLTGDLDDFAASVGGDALSISEAGKGLVRKRKQLEDNLKTLLGKDLNKSLNVTVSGAIKNLSKGETDRFREVIRAIPKAKRQEVVMTALNDVFKGSGVNQQSLSPTQFTKWYQTINRSPMTKKMLFSSLPKESRKAIDNLYELSRGISRAQGQKISTGRINALFNEDTGFIRRMVGKVTPFAVNYATGSPMASMASSSTMDFIQQSTNGARKAADLVGSEAFQNMMRRAVRDGFIESRVLTDNLMKAERQLMRTKQYKEWADMLADKGIVIGTGGILSYLFQEDEEQK